MSEKMRRKSQHYYKQNDGKWIEERRKWKRIAPGGADCNWTRSRLFFNSFF